MKEERHVRYFRTSILVSMALVSGCVWTIHYDLTASVDGLVGKENVREVAGGHYENHGDSFWSAFGNEQGQMLRVRVSTSRDLVSLAYRKHRMTTVQWHFCEKPRQEAFLGSNILFVDGTRVPWVFQHASRVVPDGQGRFVYDAILYVRDPRPLEDRRSFASGEIDEAYDLEREPRDVCMWVGLWTTMAGYKTNVARIPKEAIAATLGVKVPSATAQPSGPQQRSGARSSSWSPARDYITDESVHHGGPR